MKDSKAIIFIVFIGFICILLGVFLGRNSTNNYITLKQATEPVSHIEKSEETDLVNTQADTLGKININTASLSLLTELPGIGESIAQRIIDYRTEHGPFTGVTDLLQVDGIGEKRLETIWDLVTAKGD